MKKLAMILASVLAVAVLAGCGNSNSTSTSNSASSSSVSSGVTSQTAASSDLDAVMDNLFTGISENDLPATMPTEDGKYAALTAENSEYNVGVSRDSYVDGICADAAISVQAHSVCLLKAESEEAAANLAKEVAEKANPNKWICSMAEHKTVAYSGDTVLLAMTFNNLAEPILNNFKAEFGADNVTVVMDEEVDMGGDMGIGSMEVQDSSAVVAG